MHYLVCPISMSRWLLYLKASGASILTRAQPEAHRVRGAFNLSLELDDARKSKERQAPR